MLPLSNPVISGMGVSLMNLYPYTNGHLMVAPFRHIDSFGGINQAERLEILEQIDLSIDALSNVLNPDGFNIGVNNGEDAGQTVFHAHFHVIPRYKGDVKNPTGGIRGIIPNKGDYTKY